MKARDITILVVDDEEYIRIALERVLSRLECEVLLADRGERAIDILKEKNVDIILLDLKMPGIDGIEVLKWIKEHCPWVEVIVITGFATIDVAINCMKEGAYDFIAKPFEKDHIVLIVKRAIDNLRLRREKERLEEEKKEALLDLITEKSRLKTILEVLPNGVMVTNNKKEVVLLNSIIKEHLEIPQDISLGSHVSNYISNKEIHKFILNALEHREDSSKEIKIHNDLYLLLKKTSIIGENKKLIGHVVISIDITSFKKLDELKSEFVAKVSHELRGSLATIHEQIALVLQDILNDPELMLDKEILERAKHRARGLTELIEKLLDLSRIESGKVYVDEKEVYMEEFLNCLFEDWKDEARLKEQNITLNLDDRDFKIIADPRALKILFNNLVSNAIKYTPPKGDICISIKREGNFGIVEVKDNGIGISPSEQKKIFNRFYRVKNEKTKDISGTGLGLSIVKGIVEDLQGDIEVSSEVGKGTTFKVKLPIQE